MTEIDIFLIAGQSNAQGGCPVPVASPKVTDGKVLQWYNGSITNANDPVGNATNNSAWPSFGQTYYELTGRPVCLVPCAKGGSQMYGGTCDQTWDTTGTLYSASNSAVSAATSYLSTFGYTPLFQGILWSQGETDASNIHNATETVDQYKAALTTMIANYRGVYGANMPFYIFRTGMNKDVAWDDGYDAIRNAQEEMAATDSNTHIVFRGAKRFRGLHYTEQGQYNFMGSSAARIIAEESFRRSTSDDTDGGDWYPTIIASTTPGTPAYTIQKGSWDKIGRICRASFTIQLSGWTGSPSGAIKIGNFPFMAANSTNDGATFPVMSPVLSGLPANTYSILGIMNPGTYTASLYSCGNATVPTVNASNLGSTPLLFGNVVYRV